MQEVARRVKALGEELSGVEAELEAALATLPNPPDPTAADEDTVHARGRRAPGATGRRPPRAGRRPDRHGGGRARGRLALRLPARATSCCSSSRSCAGRWRCCAATASSPSSRPCSCARRRSTARASSRTPSSRSTACADDDLYLAGTSEVAAGLAARRARSSTPAACRCATRASRRASGARRAPPGRDTRGIFRVHQFDKVEMFCFVEPEASRDEHERLLGDRGGDPAGARASPTGSSTSRSTTSAPRRPRSTTARRGCPGRAATAS